MARTNAPGRWIMVAALALGTMLVAAACGGAPSAVVASLPASGAPSVVAATPTAVPSPSPSPVDVAAIFKKTITDPKFSAKADISGTMSVGPIDGTISGKGAFGGRDSSMDLVIDLDVVKQSTSQITVGDKKWTKKDPGPWLLDPNGATPSSSLSVGKILQSLVDVSDLGVVTKNGRSLHHLKVAGADAVSGAMFGLDPTATKDADFSLELYADAAGVPAVMSMSGSWTQVGGDKELPATMAFDITFKNVGAPQTITPPSDVWVVYTSKAKGYSMAHPADWTVTPGKSEDTYAVDGQGYVYVATTSYKGSTAKFAADLKATYKKPFKGEPASTTPKQLGGVPAVRLIYQFTRDSGGAVTVADDVVSRDGTGWEVYVATGGGQEDIDIFDTFVSTFTFTE
ncbi:MAG: hypothetical protein ACJ779_12335 [Chloroflexota bacterium]